MERWKEEEGGRGPEIWFNLVQKLTHTKAPDFSLG